MPGTLQPLDQKFAIVDSQGYPTLYFIQWAQQKQIDIGDSITLDQAQTLINDWAAARQIIAGRALDGGGFLSADVTIDHAESLVVPGAYGDATHIPKFTVDQEGHVQGVVLVPISGGGGGGYGYEGFGNLLSLAGLTKLGGASANITLVDGAKAHRYSWTASGANTLQLATAAAPATPWNLYLRFIPDAAFGANVQFGLVLRNSVSGKITTFTWNSDNSFAIQEWTNPTTFSATLLNPTSPRMPQFWFRISNDGTTLTFYRSLNGVDWVQLVTRTLAAFMASVDQVGIGGVPQSASSVFVSDFGLTVPA